MVNSNCSFDRILFDIRTLQANPLRYRPIDRYFLSLILHLPDWVKSTFNICLLAEWGLDIPVALDKWRDHVVFVLPFRRESLLVIEPAGQQTSLRRMLRKQILKRTKFLIFTDCTPKLDAESANYQFIVANLHFATQEGEIEEPSVAVLPAVLCSSLTASLTSLEKLQLELLFKNTGPLIAVDGFFAEKQDIKRVVRATAHSLGARVVLFSNSANNERDTTDFLTFLPSPALLGQIIRQATVTLIPDTESARTISIEETEYLGGRVLRVGRNLSPNELFAAKESAVPAAVKPPIHAYSSYWKEFLPTVNNAVKHDNHSRPSIAIMTPIFPQRGGPPHSSLDLVLALTDIADVDVWTDADMLSAHRAKVRAVYRLDSQFNPDNYDEVVYVMGNHPMYRPIFEHMRQHGGALILHDAHMMDFLNSQFGKKRLCELLSVELGRELTDEDVGKLMQNYEKLPRPFLGEIVRYADPVIVHSPAAAEIIRNFYGIQAMYFPVGMPYPFNEKNLKNEIRQRAKLVMGIDPSRPCVASFGEVSKLKGAKQCVFVIKELVDWGYDLQFIFVGPIDDALRSELINISMSLNIDGHIVFSGSVSEDKYIKYLQAVDIVVQIRKIPFGQVSGALLDAVSAGMYGVASENLANSIEAPPYITRVSDYGSPTLYAEQVATLLDSGQYVQRPGPGWEDFIVKHSFARYARKLVSSLYGANKAWDKEE